MNEKILVGSRAFFNRCPDFHSKDTDYLILVNKGNGFDFVRQISMQDMCIFEFVRRPKQEMIDYALTHGVPMQVGKFLVKKFAEEIGLTIEDLKQLQPLIDKLDTQHEYERIIYEYIMEKRALSTDLAYAEINWLKEQNLQSLNSSSREKNIQEKIFS